MHRTIFGDPNGRYATVIADSISPREHRLTTIEFQIWRPMLAEVNTHRKKSRNSASSRAIPVEKQLARLTEFPVEPAIWRSERPGMQGGEPLEPHEVVEAQKVWDNARQEAIASAVALMDLGVHKSITNRLLEPFMWHRIIISSTEWQNFFDQRISPLAQDDIRIPAEFIRDALEDSTPQFVDYDEWHLPYVGDDPDALDVLAGRVDAPAPWIPAAQVSAARSARVSYMTHEGQRDLTKDMDLYHGTRDGKRHGLVTAVPEHWSPLEHPATPDRPYQTSPGNFDGWLQLRHHAEAKAARPDGL